MSKENLAELRKAVIQIGKLVQRYGAKYYFLQLKLLSQMLDYIDSGNEDADYLIYCYKMLFPSRGGLTEFYIHDDDYETRKKLNAPLDEAKDVMRKILLPYLED